MTEDEEFQILEAKLQAKEKMKTQDIEDILKERGSRYGKFKDHAAISQSLKSVIRVHAGDKWHDMHPDQKEALEMICHKIARILNGDPNYIENYKDIAGYAKLVADRLMETEGATDNHARYVIRKNGEWKDDTAC